MTSTTIPNQTHLGPAAVAGTSTIIAEQSIRCNHHGISDVRLPALFQQVTAISAQGDDSLLLLDGETCFLLAEGMTEYFEAVTNALQKIWEDECFPELLLWVEEFDARKAAIWLAK